MYPNYIEDRKSLGYQVLKDTNRGVRLVLITDSRVLLIRNLPSKVNHKMSSFGKFYTESVFFWAAWDSNPELFG